MTCNERLCAGPATLPDGFAGTLLAIEGIRDAAVILHGPTGCRGYHAALSEQWFPRDARHEPLNYAERFYFGQPRIPTTYLDGDDFVFGAGEKLKQAIASVLARNPSLLAVVNAPGTALIGDDLRRCLTAVAPRVPWLVIDLPSISQPMADGHQQAMIATLQAMQLAEQPVKPKTVVLLGISIAHQHWAGSVAELRRLLELCGIEVICVAGGGSPVEEWRRIPRAACFAVLHAEYGDRVARWLSDRFPTPVLGLDTGAPIGFSATEEWLRAVAAAVGADSAPALADIGEWRRAVARKMYLINTFQDVVRGARFSIRSDPSVAFPLAQWLHQYLGMIPAAVEIPEYQHSLLAKRLREFLSEIGCSEAWQRSWQQVQSDLLFADGSQVAIALSSGLVPACVEMMLPSDTYLDILPKAMLGPRGAAYLVEQVINGLPEP
jgi:nitrogenase molybdenum-iron protein alpha/beta subunit